MLQFEYEYIVRHIWFRLFFFFSSRQTFLNKPGDETVFNLSVCWCCSSHNLTLIQLVALIASILHYIYIKVVFIYENLNIKPIKYNIPSGRRDIFTMQTEMKQLNLPSSYYYNFYLNTKLDAKPNQNRFFLIINELQFITKVHNNNLFDHRV